MNPPVPPSLAQTFALILDALCRAAAARAGRSRAAAPLVLLLWPYLRRLCVRFASLVARARAGMLPAARPARPRPAPLCPRPRLPGGFAWLLALVPEAAGFAGQLRHLLAQPEATALLAACPQAGRLLRPLCRMLGIEPPPENRPEHRHPSPGEPAEPAEAGRPTYLEGSASIAARRGFVPA